MTGQYVKIATCTLNQWSMDFEGNKRRIMESIQMAKEKGAKFRLGPEFEIPGYTCEDHFLEPDTFHHSAEVLAEILESGITDGIICDIGLPIYHNTTPYNCRVICLNGKIICIRPKMYLAGDGNYREMRWFSRWEKKGVVENHKLVPCLHKVTGQVFVPFGHCYIETHETKISSEICEELFTPNSPHIELGLCGVEIFTNGSGSHHQLRKLHNRIELIQGATSRSGGVYVYSNMIGCDGSRMNFDGCSLVSVNGQIVKQGAQFSLKEVDVLVSTVDLEQVRMFRMSKQSRNIQSAEPNLSLNYVNRELSHMGVSNIMAPESPKAVYVDFSIALDCPICFVDPPMNVHYYSAEEEIAFGPAQWTWDYLRRSGANGLFLPLSGGADSSSVATIIGHMCQMVVGECAEGNQTVINDARRILRLPANSDYIPKDPKEFAGRIFYTCYMGTENSSKETENFARNLANQIGSNHQSIKIDIMVNAVLAVFKTVILSIGKITGKPRSPPRYEQHGGTPTEDKALQNIQARLRMVFSYLMAQLLRWAQGDDGWLLVLASANVDEGLRGYLTKYDCSSADLNPIGGICKNDLKRFLYWAGGNLGYTELVKIVEAPPSAELKPAKAGEIQKDEDEMGMTYAELTLFGKLRKIGRCGPVSMFKTLVQEWGDGFGNPTNGGLSVSEVAEKVKTFFKFYSMNRHKMTTLTPSVHMENYSPEDNRHDLRQIFYNVRWPYQFKKIDSLVAEVEEFQKNAAHRSKF